MKEITKKWLGSKPKKDNKVKIYNIGDSFIFKKHKYKIDGHFIRNNFSKEELEFANWLSKKTCKKITMLPKIDFPLGISTPDYRIGNEYYDLKTITGCSKQIIYHNIRDKKKQSRNFIIDATKSSLKMLELINQTNKINKRIDTKWINIIVIRKNDLFIVLKNKATTLSGTSLRLLLH